MSPSFAVYLFLQLCMLGTAVIEEMHENKFQGDILMEFSMTVFGGIAMTFFSHELYVSPGFWQGEGHIVFVWQQPDRQGELGLVLSHQLLVGMLSLTDDVLQLQQVLLGIFNALLAGLDLQVELGNLAVELLPLGLQLEQLLADGLADAAQVLHVFHLAQLVAGAGPEDALAGIVRVVDGGQVVVGNEGEENEDDEEGEAKPGEPDPTGPPQHPRLASVPHSPIAQHRIASHEFQSRRAHNHVGSVAITKRVFIASISKGNVIVPAQREANGKGISSSCCASSSSTVVLLQAQLLIPLDSIIDLLAHPQPTLGPQATFAGSVTALSW